MLDTFLWWLLFGYCYLSLYGSHFLDGITLRQNTTNFKYMLSASDLTVNKGSNWNTTLIEG